MYSITCIQRPLKGSNESGLSQQVVFKCRFYLVDLRRIAVAEQWSLKAGGLLIQVVSNTGLTVVVKSVQVLVTGKEINFKTIQSFRSAGVASVKGVNVRK